MAPVYSGSLHPKKKSELQEIALALRISDQGTKDELVQRIVKHLDSNQDSLEDNPKFTGLFRPRKRSVQPQPIPSSRLALSDAAEKPLSSARRSITLDAIKEITPTKDLRAVSTFLKHPLSPENAASNQSPRALVALPPSPARSLVGHLQHVPVQSVVQQFRVQEILQSGNKLVISIRSFLSNSRNIWSVTAIVELFYILSSIIPWQNFELPISKGQGLSLTFPYPPLIVFQSHMFWLVLFHWALPTLIVPALIGCIITFNPALSPTNSHHEESPVAPLDPLTASIIRLAAQMGYPYSSIASKTGIVGLDVLGSNWRILSASVGLAFSFAEAIAGAPLVLTDSAINQERLPSLRRVRQAGGNPPPSRRAITATEEETPPDEVD